MRYIPSSPLIHYGTGSAYFIELAQATSQRNSSYKKNYDDDDDLKRKVSRQRTRREKNHIFWDVMAFNSIHVHRFSAEYNASIFRVEEYGK
jgi:hypothetical protein